MTYDIPFTNHQFTVSRFEIEELWQYGSPTEDSLSLSQHGEPYTRAKRSENGKWHIKQLPLDYILPPEENKELPLRGFTPEQLCILNDYELYRLRNLGLHVISYARVPFNKNIMTISPWVDGIREVSDRTYLSEVHPGLRKYYKEWLDEHEQSISIRPFYLLDSDQFSSAPHVRTPFLHDIDPAVGDSLEVVVFLDELEVDLRDQLQLI